MNYREKELESDMHDWERLACSSDSHEHQIMRRLIIYIRSLQHELNDPAYLYSGRVPRMAIVSRDCTIEKLQKEVDELKKQLAEWEHTTKDLPQ